MEFKVQNMHIATGGILVAILNKQDAAEQGMHNGERILIKKGKRSINAVLDISDSEEVIARGKIGMFKELCTSLNVKNNDKVFISLGKQPKSLRFIKKKLDGHRLNNEEMITIINDIIENNVTDIETSYFVAANYLNGLDMNETTAMTRAMINGGDKLTFTKGKRIIDKHSIGGVAGNRTTPIVVSILVAAGYTVPKTSSRSITSAAGTADTMEVMTEVSLSIKKIKNVVEKTGGCMVWGGAVNLAPADDKIIRVEHPLSIDSEGQLLASIMAKKGSVSATDVLIDIPVGLGAKVQTRQSALHLKEQFRRLAHILGINVYVLITDGRQPIGNGIGPALEARDILWILKNDKRGPKDLKKKALMMAAEIMKFCPVNDKVISNPIEYAKELLESGKAYEKFKKIIEAQGKKVVDPEKIKIASHKYNVVAPKSGTVSHIDSKEINKIAKTAGAPRDKTAGIYLHKHAGEKVKKGETLYEIHFETRQKLKFAKAILDHVNGFEID